MSNSYAMEPQDFVSNSGISVPGRYRQGHASIAILPFLNGQPWDELALAFVTMLNPHYIRVSKNGFVTTDSPLGTRVSVFMNPETQRIDHITLESNVWLPETIEDGNGLYQAARARGLNIK